MTLNDLEWLFYVCIQEISKETIGDSWSCISRSGLRRCHFRIPTNSIKAFESNLAKLAKLKFLVIWLFICCVFAAVLKSLHLIDGLRANTLNITSKTALNTYADHDLYNVKSDLMRLVANLVYQHTTNQHMVKHVWLSMPVVVHLLQSTVLLL